MAEENQVLELEQEAVDQIDDVVEQIDDVEQVEQPDLSPTEQKAWDQGWRPEENFEGNPDNWKTAGEYILYGEFQEQLREEKSRTRRKEQEFDDRIANLNKYHDKKRESDIAALKVQQRVAVEEADTERFDQLQTEIDSHEAIEDDVTPTVDPAITQWEKDNSWVMDANSEKAQQANAFFGIASSKPGATAASALAYVDEQIAKLYPEERQTNPRREVPTMTEQSRWPAPRSSKTRELTMNDLTNSEREEYKQFGSMLFSSDKDFLKAVADARKE